MGKDYYERRIYVDMEADGGFPGPRNVGYSMLSLGATSGSFSFYVELRPISNLFDPKALEVSGLDRDRLLKEGIPAKRAMIAFERWIKEVCVDARPVFVALNATFDWSFVNWYFLRYLKRNPFGISGCDIKAMYAGMMGVELWRETGREYIKKHFTTHLPHPHHAVYDAKEQEDIDRQIREMMTRTGLLYMPGERLPGAKPIKQINRAPKGMVRVIGADIVDGYGVVEGDFPSFENARAFSQNIMRSPRLMRFYDDEGKYLGMDDDFRIR